MTPHVRTSLFGIFISLLAASILATTMVLSATGSAALTAVTKATHQVPPAPGQLGPTPIPGEKMLTAVFLPLVSNSSESHVAAHGDNFSAEATSSDDSGSSSLDLPPTPNNHTFVVNTAEYLDRYLARESLPEGRLTFTIPITAPVVPLSAIDIATGRLSFAGLTFMVAKQRLAHFSLLQLRVYDVDHDAPGCSEVDLVSVNGNLIEHDLTPARLRSGDSTWDTWSIPILTSYLYFPIETDDNTQPVLPAINEISIDVDTQCIDQWALTVDWGAISIRPRLDYLMLLVHGWTGGTDTFQTKDINDGDFVTYATADDYRTYAPALNSGIGTITNTAKTLAEEIINTVVHSDTEKVYIVAHSRGGLFTRFALRQYPFLASMIAGYITVSTPHHGVNAADELLANDFEIDLPIVQNVPIGRCNQTSITEREKCKGAAKSFRRDVMIPFNYGLDCKKEIFIERSYYIYEEYANCEAQWTDQERLWIPAEEKSNAFTIVGSNFLKVEIDAETATFPWRSDSIPFPAHSNVDAQFSHDHQSIVNQRDVYEYVIQQFGLVTTPIDLQPANMREAVATSEPPPGQEQQILAYYSGTVAAGQVQGIAVPVEAVTSAAFTVAARQPITVTLVNPAGEVIDAATPSTNPSVLYAATAPEADDATPGWYYQYLVEAPGDGVWQVQIEAPTATDVRVTATALTARKLGVYSDATNYRPGQTITIEALVMDAIESGRGTLQTGVALSGSVRLPDNSTFPLVFYDDGTHGDKHVGNNIYTAQFPAPAVTDEITVLVEAKRGNLQRINGLHLAIYGQTASILGVSGERAVDADGDGYFNTLDLDIGIDVLEAGNYNVEGDLYSPGGEKIAHGAFSSLDHEGPLATGAHTVTLSFYGRTLREAGIDGPYLLDRLKVQHHLGEFPLPAEVASARNVYTTAAYTAAQFDGDDLRVLATDERAEDLTGDGLYDSLIITATFDVLQPGQYEWRGVLVDAGGAPVAQTEGRGQLDGQQPAVFIFAGGQIRTAGLDGPYTLTDVYMTRLEDTVANFYFDDLHSTASYQAAQFGATPIVLDPVEYAALDLNDNGLYDALVISATVAAVEQEGAYTWSWQLAGPDGMTLAADSMTGQLYNGKVLTFPFLSPIFHNANLDGVYALQNVVLTNQANPAITAVVPLLYATPSLHVNEFDVWEFQATGVGAQAIDYDENGLIDRLVFTSTLAMPLAGDYELEFALVSQQAPNTVVASTDWFGWYEPGEEEDITYIGGEEIGNAGIDGPFLVRFAKIDYHLGETITVPVAANRDVFTTEPYLASQFQTFPIIPLPAAVLAQPVDEDGDRTYPITWTPVPGAVTYKLLEWPQYYAAKVIYAGADTSFEVANRAPGRTFCYSVITVRNLRLSRSNEECITTAPEPTATPEPALTPRPPGGGSIGGG